MNATLMLNAFVLCIFASCVAFVAKGFQNDFRHQLECYKKYLVFWTFFRIKYIVLKHLEDIFMRFKHFIWIRRILIYI